MAARRPRGTADTAITSGSRRHAACCRAAPATRRGGREREHGEDARPRGAAGRAPRRPGGGPQRARRTRWRSRTGPPEFFASARCSARPPTAGSAARSCGDGARPSRQVLVHDAFGGGPGEGRLARPASRRARSARAYRSLPAVEVRLAGRLLRAHVGRRADRHPGLRCSDCAPAARRWRARCRSRPPRRGRPRAGCSPA